MSDPVVECMLRPATADDTPFVLSSWLQSAASDAGGMAALFGRKTFYAEHERLIRESVLPRSRVRVASSPDAPDAIRGWACFEETEHGTHLHYVYVRFDWRYMGIAKCLVDSIGDIALQTHKVPRAACPFPFNPYPLFLGATWRPSHKLSLTTTLSTRSREPSAETESQTSLPEPTSRSI